MNDILYIVMPAYNEEKNIETTVKQWYPLLRIGGGEIKAGSCRQWKYRFYT